MKPSEQGYTSQNSTRSLPISARKVLRYESNFVPPWTTSRRSGQISATVDLPDCFLMRSKSVSIHDGTPDSAVIGWRIESSASTCNFLGQSGMRLTSSGG